MDRFARSRRVVYVAVAANAILAIGLAIGIHLTQPIVEARFDRGFPADLLVVRNLAERPLTRVELELDQTYVYRTEALEPGTRTFDLRRSFRDDEGTPPPIGYVPRRLRVAHARGVEAVPVAGDEPP